MAPPESPERAARNESIFRELNDQLEAIAEGSPVEVRGFVCECADMSCSELVALSLGEYEAVRRDPQHFIVVPRATHVDTAVERVVERFDGYWVVEKVGIAGNVAEDLDSRG